MASGRPPLDPDLKKQRLRESRRRYEENAAQDIRPRNTVQRREAARLRMQRRRAAIASSDIFTRRKHARKVAEDSENYRDRKIEKDRANQRAADAARKDVRNQAHFHRKAISAHPFVQIRPERAAFNHQACRHRKAARSATAVPSLLHGGVYWLRLCMCPKSEVWTEHGGHLGQKYPLLKSR
ncbi:hypothetical protein B0H14DRAFT_2558559 [Mycena olivaceomarginata]|nr:hypothetical protein B0H14DRAFT_2558559 [Mycena olivaceomarginata]